MSTPNKKFDFEESVKRLEQISDKLESGDISLDESIKLFEQGIKLSHECSEYLEKAKQKITNISQAECEE